jgi:hypothetical protein
MKKQDSIPIVNIHEADTKSASSGVNNKIYIRAVKGVIERCRRYVGILFLSLFLLIPWLTYNDQQAVLLDFVEQRFHLFNLSLWPQDLTIFAWLFIIAAFALFFYYCHFRPSLVRVYVPTNRIYVSIRVG